MHQSPASLDPKAFTLPAAPTKHLCTSIHTNLFHPIAEPEEEKEKEKEEVKEKEKEEVKDTEEGNRASMHIRYTYPGIGPSNSLIFLAGEN